MKQDKILTLIVIIMCIVASVLDIYGYIICHEPHDMAFKVFIFTTCCIVTVMVILFACLHFEVLEKDDESPGTKALRTYKNSITK